MRRAVALSPILIKEMRSTMRGRRAFIGMTLFQLLLMAVSVLMYLQLSQESVNNAEAGQILFAVLLGLELLLLFAIAPTLTAGAIAGERQRQTFDMLMATPLTPAQVLRGKLMASINFALLLVVASVPFNTLVFVFGGVTLLDLGQALLFALTLLVMLACLGLLWSTFARSGGAANTMALVSAVLVFIVLPALIGILLVITSLDNDRGCFAAATLLLLHPLGTFYSIITDELPSSAGRILPATLPLFAAVAGLLFMGAEARLAALVGQQRRRLLPIGGLLLVALAASGYLIWLVSADNWC